MVIAGVNNQVRWQQTDFADADALSQTTARDLAQACIDGVAARGRALLALAGGRTPLPAYRQLASMDLPWNRVDVVATDERCVPHDHPACNGRELREAFAPASGVSIHMLTPPDGDAITSEAHARRVLEQFPFAFDSVVLGMGGDAHTASLFPQTTALPRALADDAEAAYRIDPLPLPPEAPYPRVSLSRARLIHARTICLLITGDAKRDVLRAARASPDHLQRPISAFLDTPLHVYWSP